VLIDSIIVGPIQVNCYIVSCPETKKCVVIDPGDEQDAILRIIENKHLFLDKILLTHAHFDHIGAAAPLSKKTQAPIYIHKNEQENLLTVDMQCDMFNLPHLEAFQPDHFVVQDDEITCGSCTIKVLETPGHTAGGISFYTPGHVFAGDTLFYNSIGRTDLPGGNYNQLVRSIRQQLFTLPDETKVHSGHGPATVIHREKQSNPFLN